MVNLLDNVKRGKLSSYRFSFSGESVNDAESNVKQKLCLKSDGSICLSSLYEANESASSLCTCIRTALSITASARWTISKTLLSEALSTFCWEKKQFSSRGRRHKGRLSKLPEALQETCGAAESSSQLGTAGWGAGDSALPACWRGTRHAWPWQNCEQPAAQQAERVRKGARTLLKVREGLFSGGLISLYRAFADEGSKWLLRLECWICPYGSTWSLSLCHHTKHLPSCWIQGDGKLPAFLSGICLW